MMGTTVRDQVPLAVEDPTRPFHVLILDDDDLDTQLLTAACLQVGEYRVICRRAPDLPTARRLLAEIAFDLVFADYWLGSETSVSLVVELAHNREAPPVVMTSSADTLDVQTIGLRAGAVTFLPKADITRTTVRAAIHAAATRPRRQAGDAEGAIGGLADRLAMRAEEVAVAAAVLHHTDRPSREGLEDLRSLAEQIRSDAEAMSEMFRQGRP
jgi:DNA-binding response OmpR family regulator